MNYMPPILDDSPGLSYDYRPGAIDSESAAEAIGRLDVFHGYMGVFIVAFLVTLLATPIMRRLAIANGVIDRPDDPRKVHKIPVAYLGGVAVFIGILAGVAYSYAAAGSALPLIESHVFNQQPVPFSVLAGLMLIMLAGLGDDVFGMSPRIKIALQLVAAAALALEDVGVKVAQGVLGPIGALIGNERLIYTITAPEWLHFLEPGAQMLQLDLIYWAGTAIIAVFILGACNASNLIDGLDGLCSGVTAIAAAGLLIIALTLAVQSDGPLDSSRLVLCLCLLGACMGFLPHNFNPATIFLGDAGSMLLGYTTIVIVLTLGDTGKTPLVVAGLIIYSLPIIDTTLAIVRRKLTGRSMSDADDQHLHHMLKRALGVKGAVFTMYGIAASFAALGVLISLGRARVAYAIALVIAAYIVVTAIKIARRSMIESQAADACMLERSMAAPTTPNAGDPPPARPRRGRAPAKDGAPIEDPDPHPA
ncbi:MAG: undecaprenyl/decaprenyl-phosphate alpha-N-acetylglucosaminyl 1-phosphate transferase [Phycisphaeraceae bacterium]|nr:MAG: undecaprenyl/decaprenyl-phosphate alpha-N-acetylglucosaminyl 1-phosphate transferase [Phycisphaeraceae bacterium]